MAIGSELRDDSQDARQAIISYAWILADLGRPVEAGKELERALEPEQKDVRAERVAEVYCWDRNYLGQGTSEWRRLLKRSAGFMPSHCDESEEPGAPLLKLDSALWERPTVEEPHC